MKKRKNFKVLRSGVLHRLVAIVVVFGFPYVQAQAQEGATNPLQGVWSVTKLVAADGTTSDPAQPGFVIFEQAHYSAVYTLGSDPRPLSKTAFAPTHEEMLAQYTRLIVNTGTYEVDGSVVSIKPLLAKSPEFIGGSATMKFQVDGDILTLTTLTTVAADGSTPPGGGSGVMTLRRLE